METSSENTLSSQEQNLSRRELLKVLAAGGGGLAAAAFLPGRWLKPVVEAGVLPAHAQATNTLKLVSLFVWSKEPRSQLSNGCNEQPWGGSATYTDDLCKAGVDLPSVLVPSATPYGLSNFIQDPITEPCHDGVLFSFDACCDQEFSVYIQVGGRKSAPLNDTLTSV